MARRPKELPPNDYTRLPNHRVNINRMLTDDPRNHGRGCSIEAMRSDLTPDSTRSLYMTVGAIRFPIGQWEEDEFRRQADAYIAEHGVAIGFLSHLLDASKDNPS